MRRSLTVVLFVLGILFIHSAASACGHDGFYVGGGFTQRFLFTGDRQIGAGAGSGNRVAFGPAPGGQLILGYDFCGSRWGVQFPFEYSTFRLNSAERVHLLGSSLEGVLHLAAWEDGFDFRLIGGFGWNYLTEGSLDNRSASIGLNAGIGPGFAWYFTSRGKERAGAIAVDAPFRAIIFFGDRLSASQTTVYSIPVRLTLTVGF